MIVHYETILQKISAERVNAQKEDRVIKCIELSLEEAAQLVRELGHGFPVYVFDGKYFSVTVLGITIKWLP